MEILVEDSDTVSLSSITVRMEYVLQLEYFSLSSITVNMDTYYRWNTYYLTLITVRMENFVWKANKGEAESIVLLIFVLWDCFNRHWVKGGGVWQKVIFRASWMKLHPFSWSNKHDTFWHVISTGYFYVWYLWAIAIPDICSLEIFISI